jgi:enoyl-CoA hydratase/carnithine racemase
MSPSAGNHDPSGRIELTFDGKVALIMVRHPPHNFLTEPLLRSLADTLAGLGGSTRAAVIGSEGRSFCAGANFRSGDAPDPASGSTFEASTRAFYAQAARIFTAPVPLVAAVHGPAVGAGLGLALACDLRVLGQNAWLAANFVRLGIHPGFAISLTLPRLVGPGRASDMLLTGRRVEAAEAASMGLAERLVSSGTEIEVAIRLAHEIAHGAPLAVASTRATLRQGLAADAAEALSHELAEQARLAGTADAIEGVSAMLEGREPTFDGI